MTKVEKELERVKSIFVKCPVEVTMDENGKMHSKVTLTEAYFRNCYENPDPEIMERYRYHEQESAKGRTYREIEEELDAKDRAEMSKKPPQEMSTLTLISESDGKILY